MNYTRPWVRDEDDSIQDETAELRSLCGADLEPATSMTGMLQRVELIGDALCACWAKQRWRDIEREIDIRYGVEMRELEELRGECPVALGYYCWATFKQTCRKELTCQLLDGVGNLFGLSCLDGMVDRIDKVVAPPPKGHKLRPVWDKWVRVRKTRKTKKQG